MNSKKSLRNLKNKKTNENLIQRNSHLSNVKKKFNNVLTKLCEKRLILRTRLQMLATKSLLKRLSK